MMPFFRNLSSSRFMTSSTRFFNFKCSCPVTSHSQSPSSQWFRQYSASRYYENKRPDLHLPQPENPQASQSWGTYIIAAAVLVFTGAGVLIHYNDERRAVLKGTSQEQSDSVKRPALGGPFTLINTEFQIVKDQDLKGCWNILYFGYTSSPDVCPNEIQKMVKAIRVLEAENNLKVRPVFITIDPQRDGPSHLRAYLHEIGPSIVGLTGSISSVRQVAQEYRVYFKRVEEEGQDYLVDSSHNMYLMDPSMNFVRSFGVEYSADELVTEILGEVKRGPAAAIR